MRCSSVQQRSSAYLDGELSPQESSTIRGHLRTCDDCAAQFAREQQLIVAAGSLQSMDPPDALWAGITQQLAKEEIKDSQQNAFLRWLRKQRHHWQLATGMTLAIASVVFVLHRQSNQVLHSNSQHDINGPASAAEVQSVASPLQQETFAAVREAEVHMADRHYMATIAELREILLEDRSHWSETQSATISEKLSVFSQNALSARNVLASAHPQSRELLYAGYRAEILFLHSALAGDIPDEGVP